MAIDITSLDSNVPSGTTLDILSSRVSIEISSGDTDGAYAVLEYEAAPRLAGPPLHYHAATEEYIAVLEGTLPMTLGDNQILVNAGEGVRIPRGVAHTFANPGDEPVRFLVTLVPGGFEGYLAEAARRSATGQWPPAAETLADLNRRFDQVLVAGH